MKKVSIYNEKGKQGKSLFAVEIALRLGFCYATNQNRPRKDIQAIISPDEFLQVAPHEAFPALSDEIKVVFDLAGELVGYQKSIVSALRQSDVILVPVMNESDAISATKHAITELENLDLKAEIIILATDLRRGDREEILESLKQAEGSYKIFTIRHSELFKRMMLEGKSVSEMGKATKLSAWSHRFIIEDTDYLFNYLTRVKND
jgi:hypothetical protein